MNKAAVYLKKVTENEENRLGNFCYRNRISRQ